MQISIITVCYNDVEALKRTINSVRTNKTKGMSFYVIDGNSKDGTFELLTKNLDVINDYIVENDLGLYEAMNKCTRFDIPNESFLFFLNAGDELLHHGLTANKVANEGISEMVENAKTLEDLENLELEFDRIEKEIPISKKNKDELHRKISAFKEVDDVEAANA